MKQVIFDTDIGIDDAMALLFLHRARTVDLQAIITGYGNASVDATTRNALFMREKFDIEAPIYRGASGPIGTALFYGYPDFVHGENGLGNIDIPNVRIAAESQAGAEAIVDIVRRQPGQVSIVAVGRMTNIALALEICPDLPQLVKELVVMGGVFGFNGHRGNVSPVAEANIAGDPQAADRVFSSGLATTIVGLDVTQEVIMDRAYFDALRSTAGLAGEFIYDIGRFYLDFHEQLTGRYACPVHDSSAVAYLLQPDLFTTRDAAVRVATDGIAMGQTIWGDPGADYESDAWSNRPVCKICTTVDSDAMLNLYRLTLASAID